MGVAEYLSKLVTEKYYSTFCIPPEIRLESSPIKRLKIVTTQHIVIIRGFLTYSLDLKKGKMNRKADTRRDRGHFSATIFRGEVYAIGTLSVIAAGTIEKYNPAANNWQHFAMLPKKLKFVSSAVLENKLYVLGGLDTQTLKNSDSTYVYDPDRFEGSLKDSSACWEILAHSLLQPRARHAAVGFQGKLWIAGGCLDSEIPLNSVEVFDPAVNMWMPASPMLTKRVFGHLLIVDNNLFAVGGDVDDSGSKVTRTIERYRSDCDVWEFVANFKDDRRGFSASSVGSKIYVFGGSTTGETYNDTWDAFDVNTLTWASDTTMGGYGRMPCIEDWGQAVTIPASHMTWT